MFNLSLGKRSSSVDEEQHPVKKQKVKVFDLILAGSEEDEYHFKPHKVLGDTFPPLPIQEGEESHVEG